MTPKEMEEIVKVAEQMDLEDKEILILESEQKQHQIQFIKEVLDERFSNFSKEFDVNGRGKKLIIRLVSRRSF